MYFFSREWLLDKMQMPQFRCCSFRTVCFIIGYLNLFVSILDIGSHLLVVSIESNGFECDVDKESLRVIDFTWLVQVLLIINLGTHGINPLLFMINRNKIMIPEEPRCYPGMVHVNRIDVIGYLMNAIWLKFALSFVISLHKRDPERMRRFFRLFFMKLIFEVMVILYQLTFNELYEIDIYWFLQFMDVGMAALFLRIINKYNIQLRNEKAQNIKNQPPPYIEFQTNGPVNCVDEKKEVTLPIEKKKDDNLV